MEILPQIIIYIVVGYIFIKIFSFVALKKNSSDIEHALTSSLVVGYTYCYIVNLLPISHSNEVVNLFSIVSSCIVAYLLGMCVNNKKFVKILDFLKIRDTGNVYYWDDIMDNTYPMKIKIVYDDLSYEGMLHNYESYSNSPHVVLSSYVVLDNKGNKLYDYISNNSKTVILNTENAKCVEITYADESVMNEDIRNLSESNRKLFDKIK